MLQVSHAVLLDPVCFLLFLPDVCTNFVYKTPTIDSPFFEVRL